MLIKSQALPSHLGQKLAAVYILFGPDPFLLNEAADSLKLAWKAANKEEVAETILRLDNPSDWTFVAEEARTYPLFARASLIDLRYEKKTLEASAKDFLSHYLGAINPSCLLVLRAPNLSLKSLQDFTRQENLHLIQATAPSGLAMQQWVSKKLEQKGLKFEHEIPALIHRFTEGNSLACAQLIEKLELIYEAGTLLTTSLLAEQLVDQCHYQLFELADACLAQNPEKAMQVLGHARHTKVEPALILWFLAQEIRLLIQLIELTTMNNLPFTQACNQLKIRPQRTRLYQTTLKKIQLKILLQLLKGCKTIDENIKSNQSRQIWQALEQLALSLCLTKPVGTLA